MSKHYNQLKVLVDNISEYWFIRCDGVSPKMYTVYTRNHYQVVRGNFTQVLHFLLGIEYAKRKM